MENFTDILDKFEKNNHTYVLVESLTQKEMNCVRRALKTLDAIEDVLDEELELKYRR
jgi:hypothetical protein